MQPRKSTRPPVPLAETAKECKKTSSGFEMSVNQLSELWKYDMTLAHQLMGLPLRDCSAILQEEENMPAMDINSFTRLKTSIKRMWFEAEEIFTARKTFDCGWGLFVREDHDASKRVLTPTSALRMGWIARFPGPENPTHHRYLRSPCQHHGNNDFLYLGGPLSLCNYDPHPNLKVDFSISSKEERANFVFVQKTEKLEPGDEVFWTYNISKQEMEDGSKDFYQEREWKLSCCSETDLDLVSNQPPKRVCKRSSQPHKDSVKLKGYRFCTYCGLNAADLKLNMKCHIALKHPSELCAEMSGEENYVPGETPISSKAFLQHLDAVSNAYNTLHNLGYKVLPACHIFEHTGYYCLSPESSEEQREGLLSALDAEAKRAFSKYQIIYARGISKPTKYEHFLKPPNSGYGSVNWIGDRPSSTNFSLSNHPMSQEESEAHLPSVKKCIHNLGTMWMILSPTSDHH